MTSNNKHITRFEHQTLKVGRVYNKVLFTETYRRALETHFGNGVKYFSLINKGIQFNENVGVLQVGDLVIEILPKADKSENENRWRNILIGMLKAVGIFNIQAPSSSSLNVKSNFILDLYFELFIKEVEYLFNKGLVKKYRKTEGNSLALKGNILFSKHIQQNIVHQERFYVRHTQYDKTHLLHQILHETLLLLKRINTNVVLNSRIGNLLLNFPETERLKVTESSFNKITLNRKTEDYKNALEIARLLLLNYHPDLSNGQHNVLALMFDMNMLWERFIYVSLRKHKQKGMKVTPQNQKDFWKPEKGSNSRMKPDIVINKGEEDAFVLDTKWKNIGNKNPSPDDLRQLYVYHEYYKAKRVALIYPGPDFIKQGRFYNPDKEISKKECSVISIPANRNIQSWQEDIGRKIFDNWLRNDPLT